MRNIYKTTVVSIKNSRMIEVLQPDFSHNWELHSVSTKKKNLLYHWKAITQPLNLSAARFVSSEEDYQNSLEMIKSHVPQNSESDLHLKEGK
jgi:lipoate synthase